MDQELKTEDVERQEADGKDLNMSLNLGEKLYMSFVISLVHLCHFCLRKISSMS